MPTIDHEEVLAQHGEYEEYLAYDCQPPESPTDSPRTNHRGWTERELGESSDGLAPKEASALLDSPKREIENEIMDQLFDELWRQLTPDLAEAALRLKAAAKSGLGSNPRRTSESHAGRAHP